jgi:glycerophosphoryl diester phosphodiesterase
MPRLSEVFALTRRARNYDVRFNIETKVSPLLPEQTLPPVEFTERLLAVIYANGMSSQVTIQSFDWRTLQIVQKEAPEIRTMYLSSSNTLASPRGRLSPWLNGFSPDLYGGSVPRAISAAGGKIWAPNQTYLTPAMLTEAHALGIVVIPWTVNEPAMMTKLIDMGVDGIISDRPDVVQIELKKRK